MPSKIRILSEKSINEIAAGEVVEGPASIIKELIENAVDAKATEIDIDIQGGGQALISVADNGEGMNKDDAQLAFERHATSKIASSEDLKTILTMGFRGEALASIAAVAKVNLVTADEKDAVEVVVHGGKFLAVKSAARARGTTITVQNLFYNTPARKKFLKSASALTGEIVKIVTKLSLAHPHVAFYLKSEVKTLLKTKRGSKEIKARVEDLFGKEFLRGLKKVEFTTSTMHILGFVGDVHQTRSNRLGQYLFINNRPVEAKLISNAVKAGYSTRIGKTEHPIFCLWCRFTSEEIDVNVHPQKKEVRFQKEEEVYESVFKAVEKALLTSPAAAFSNVATKVPLFKNTIDIESFQKMKKEPQQMKTTYPKKQMLYREPYVPKHSFSDTTKSYEKEKIKTIQPNSYAFELLALHGHIAIARLNQESVFEEIEFAREDLFLVDLSRTEASVLYYQMLENLKTHKSIPSEGLLIPETVECLTEEYELITKEIHFFEMLGIGIQPFGKSTFLINSLPQFINIEEGKRLIFDLIRMMPNERSNAAILGKLLKYRREKKSYLEEHAKSLLKQIFTQEDPFYTPNGQRTICHISEASLEEMFIPKTQVLN